MTRISRPGIMLVLSVVTILPAAGRSAHAQTDPCVEVLVHRQQSDRHRSRGGPALGGGVVSAVLGAVLGGIGFGVATSSTELDGLEDRLSGGVALGIGGGVLGAVGAGLSIGGGVELTLSRIQAEQAAADAQRCGRVGGLSFTDEVEGGLPRESVFSLLEGEVLVTESGDRFRIAATDLSVASDWKPGARLVFADGRLLNRDRMRAVLASPVSGEGTGRHFPSAESLPPEPGPPSATIPFLARVGPGAEWVETDSGARLVVDPRDRESVEEWRVGAQVVVDETDRTLINLVTLASVRLLSIEEGAPAESAD